MFDNQKQKYIQFIITEDLENNHIQSAGTAEFT